MNGCEDVRRCVARAYANVVSMSAPDGSSGTPVQKGTLVKHAGYDREELASLPKEAVVNSCGCGNPLAYSEVREGDVVLDLGSGAGIDLLIAAKKVGPSGKAIGVDMTDEMIDKALQIVAESGLGNVEIRKGLIENLPVDSASVDWVISNCVVNLSPEKEKVFAEIARVLRPGGRMIVSDVVAEDLPESVRSAAEFYNCCIAGAISEEAYSEGLRRAGLTDVEIRERIEYDAGQLRELVRSDHRAYSKRSCCGGENDESDVLDSLAEACSGNVWSAKILARKPA